MGNHLSHLDAFFMAYACFPRVLRPYFAPADIKLWKSLDDSKEEKMQLLIDSRKILSDFIEKHPDCPFSEQAQEMMQTLPQPE